VDIYYESNRPDLDNGLKVILDCLQYAGVIKNDRNCIEIVARKLVDKTNPRAEITLEVLERNGGTNTLR
jgi:Holliday junction resolvase RusA-like endonuclease